MPETTRAKATPVYTEDPAIIDAYETAERAFQEAQVRLIAAASALGADGVSQFRSFHGHVRLDGLVPTRGTEPPAGWYRRKKDGLWRPIRQTSKTGPEVAAAHEWMVDHRPAPLPLSILREHGLDPMVRTAYTEYGDCHVGSARVSRLDGKLFVDPRLDHWDGTEPDPARWHPIKRSEFEALLEQALEAAILQAKGANA